MAEHELRLPKYGMQMVEAEIVEWLVDDGATVTKAQEVLIVSTDKVDTPVEAPATGTIRILVTAGETVQVAAILATISAP